jgi:hypothetical protein
MNDSHEDWAWADRMVEQAGVIDPIRSEFVPEEGYWYTCCGQDDLYVQVNERGDVLFGGEPDMSR